MTELSEEEAPQQKLDFEMLGLQDDLMNNYLFALIKLKRGLFSLLRREKGEPSLTRWVQFRAAHR